MTDEAKAAEAAAKKAAKAAEAKAKREAAKAAEAAAAADAPVPSEEPPAPTEAPAPPAPPAEPKAKPQAKPKAPVILITGPQTATLRGTRDGIALALAELRFHGGQLKTDDGALLLGPMSCHSVDDPDADGVVEARVTLAHPIA